MCYRRVGLHLLSMYHFIRRCDGLCSWYSDCIEPQVQSIFLRFYSLVLHPHQIPVIVI